jgi:hypothetical protein
MSISFAEYKELPKKEVKKNKLEPGKKYYIQDTTRKLDKYKTVYKGVFIEKRGDSNIFSEVEFVVAPFGMGGKPFGFNAKSGHKFLEVIETEPINRISDSESSGSRSSSRSRSRSSTKKGGRKLSKRRRTVRRHSRK